jgi:hypothetical protein
LRRFIFEQRSRVLARLADCLRSSEPGSPLRLDVTALLDLDFEAAELAKRTELEKEIRKPGSVLTLQGEINATLNQTLAESARLNEPAGKLADRIRAVYNQALSQHR